MATVKGDVHDIGKNIVGVVLQCNGFEVIDLGVMVPWQDILQAANDNQADMIGLSGLITPSLDEMVTVAGEMQRAGHEDAAADRRRDDEQGPYGLRIDPAYQGPVIHVLDASRAVGVASSLVVGYAARAADPGTAEDYREAPRSRAIGSGQNELATLEEARANAFPFDPSGQARRRRNIPGLHHFGEWPLADLRDVDRLDALLPRLGTGRQLSRDPRGPGRGRKRAQPVRGRAGDARPDHRRTLAHAQGDGRPVALQTRRRRRPRPRRQRLDSAAIPSPAGEEARGPGRTCASPTSSTPTARTGSAAFAVGIHGLEPHLERFKRPSTIIDDILLKALADRLAESLRRGAARRMSATACGAMPTSI